MEEASFSLKKQISATCFIWPLCLVYLGGGGLLLISVIQWAVFVFKLWKNYTNANLFNQLIIKRILLPMEGILAGCKHKTKQNKSILKR